MIPITAADNTAVAETTETKTETARQAWIRPLPRPVGERPSQASGGCRIRTREGLHSTRFPNPLTEIQKSLLGFIYAPKAMWRTQTDGDKRGQLRPKLRPGCRHPS